MPKQQLNPVDDLLVQVDVLKATWLELMDIVKRPMHYGIADFMEYINKNGNAVTYKLDDLRHDIEYGAEFTAEIANREGTEALRAELAVSV